MSLAAVLGIAVAEMRTIRRLVRYWLFTLLSVGIALLAYGYYSTIHSLFSSYSATVGAVNPKYILPQIGLWSMVLLIVGVVFLAFDVRARDVRERVFEVLDVRPSDNTELLAGRLLGTFVMSWLPLLGTATLIQLFASASSFFGWPIGGTIEWRSLLAFLTVLAVPTFLLTIALVYLVSVLVRSRFLAALVSLGVIGGTIFLVLYAYLAIIPLMLGGGGAGNETWWWFLFAAASAIRLFDAWGLI